jgi:flagellin-like protein
MISKLREKANGFGGDERAVSPVVGVALLIAITVILAAVIGFVVLNTSNQTTDVPSARLDLAQTADSTITAVHDGGDGVSASNIEVVVVSDNDDTTYRNDLTAGGTSGELTTGDEITIGSSTFDNDGTTGYDSGDTVRLVWNDPDSDRKSQLATFEVK